jgi:hypothetical protein
MVISQQLRWLRSRFWYQIKAKRSTRIYLQLLLRNSCKLMRVLKMVISQQLRWLRSRFWYQIKAKRSARIYWQLLLRNSCKLMRVLKMVISQQLRWLRSRFWYQIKAKRSPVYIGNSYCAIVVHSCACLKWWYLSNYDDLEVGFGIN